MILLSSHLGNVCFDFFFSFLVPRLLSYLNAWKEVLLLNS